MLPWRSKKKSDAELVKATREAVLHCSAATAATAASSSTAAAADSSGTIAAKLGEVSQNLALMKAILYGEPDVPPNKEAGLELAREILKTEMLELLVTHLPLLEFECRKDVSQVFSNLLRKHADGEHITVSWVARNAGVLQTMLTGYERPKVALNYGIMLRESIRHEALAALLLPSPERHTSFYKLFEYVESPFFDVASDAFASLKDLLTRHKPRIAAFLDEQYTEFFSHFHALLRSGNYVTKRQSLKLLGELLLDRSNFAIMTRYISSADNLKTIMILLRDKSSSIQFEAFHVFKIFVANPKKEARVLEMLLRNKEKLLAFMSSFQNDKADDEQFSDEKRFLVEEISKLQPPARAPVPPRTASEGDGVAEPTDSCGSLASCSSSLAAALPAVEPGM